MYWEGIELIMPIRGFKSWYIRGGRYAWLVCGGTALDNTRIADDNVERWNFWEGIRQNFIEFLEMFEATDDSAKSDHFFVETGHCSESDIKLTAIWVWRTSVTVSDDARPVVLDSEGLVLEIAIVDGDTWLWISQLNKSVLLETESHRVAES